MPENSPLKAVLERDIDLLLLEELHCSPMFQAWLACRIFGASAVPAKLLGAWHSVTHPTLGESDLEAAFLDQGGYKIHVLIENKIDASFQPEQSLRYTKRGREYLDKKVCDSFKTVLICPTEYLRNLPEVESQFDSTLTYEAIRDWFLEASGLGARGEYKAAVITAGIQEARRGYQPIINRDVTDFWTKYWKLAEAIAPELEMPRPSAKPRRAGFVVFRPVGVSPGMRIVHKLGMHGSVDLEFAGMADKIERLKAKYGKHLEKDMRLFIAGKSAAVRIKVPVVDTLDDFDRQVSSVKIGIYAARKLYKWITKLPINHTRRRSSGKR